MNLAPENLKYRNVEETVGLLFKYIDNPIASPKFMVESSFCSIIKDSCLSATKVVTVLLIPLVECVLYQNSLLFLAESYS